MTNRRLGRSPELAPSPPNETHAAKEGTEEYIDDINCDAIELGERLAEALGIGIQDPDQFLDDLCDEATATLVGWGFDDPNINDFRWVTDPVVLRRARRLIDDAIEQARAERRRREAVSFNGQARPSEPVAVPVRDNGSGALGHCPICNKNLVFGPCQHMKETTS